MGERIVFYDAGLIADQIDEGEEYGVIKRILTILIVDYVLISESPHYHNRFTLYDKASAVEFTDLIEIHTLELSKLLETEVFGCISCFSCLKHCKGASENGELYGSAQSLGNAYSRTKTRLPA